jgi:hypothetical protein
MVKRTREADAGGLAEAAGVASFAAPAVAECEFCRGLFKGRGLKIHQSRCKAKTAKREPPPIQQQHPGQHGPQQQHEQQRSKHRFRIGNGHVFGYLLSFLSNQSQTKLQLVTGDRYPTCEPLLSRYCCACENDNPALFDGLCSTCATAKRNYKPLITTTEAKRLYCLKDFTGVPCVRRKYAHADLDQHAVATFGSRLAWLRIVGPHHLRVKRQEAMKKQKRDELEDFLQALSPAFAIYYAKCSSSLKAMPNSELEVCSERFDELVEALKQRGLELPTDSNICTYYIAQGAGKVGEVVDNTEEKAFLLSHTDYLARSSEDIAAGRETLDELHFSEEEDMMVANSREDAKAALCVEFLLNNRGLTLPRKWEDCRARLEEVRAGGDSLMEERLYIYTGLSNPGSSDEFIESDYY